MGSDRYGTNLGTALQLAQFRDDAPSQAYFRIPQVFPCFFLKGKMAPRTRIILIEARFC